MKRFVDIVEPMTISILGERENEAAGDEHKSEGAYSRYKLSVLTQHLNECILKVIHDAIGQLKISLLLPRIFENPLTVQDCLRGTAYQEIGEKLLVYLRERASRAPPQVKERELSDSQLLDLIGKFQENSELAKLLPDWLGDLTKDDRQLLDALRLLHQIANDHLKRSYAQVMDSERAIHRMYQQNEDFKKEVARLDSRLREQKISLLWRIAARGGLSQHYDKIFPKYRLLINLHMRRMIHLYGKKVRSAQLAAVSRKRELDEKRAYTIAMAEKTHIEDQAELKRVREEKGKQVARLQALIRKNDAAFLEKTRENIYLEAELKAKKRDFDLFMIDYNLLEQEHKAFVQAEEERMQRSLEHKLRLVQITHAVLVLQRYFRAWQKRVKGQMKRQSGEKKAKKAKGTKKLKK